MKFNKIPETTFQELQLNAGVILKSFDPKTATVDVANIIGATTGGVSFSATPTYSDYGSDIDNCPKNMKELKKLDEWAVSMSGTYITVNADAVKNLIGAADIDKTDTTKIVPRNDITEEDFNDIWWVGDYSDKNGETNGGYMAIHLINALSTGGFSVKSADKAKGQFAFGYEAHYSMDDQTKVPFEVYVKAGTAETTTATTTETEE